MNLTKVKDVQTKQSFVEALDEQLDTILYEDVETAWTTLWDTIYSSAKECFGLFTRRHRDWFNENHAHCPSGTPLWSLVYYQERCSKEHQQYRSA